MFEGATCSRLKDSELRSVRGSEIAMIFQDPMTSLNPVLTIGRQIREVLETHFDLSLQGGETPRCGADRRESGSRAPSCG